MHVEERLAGRGLVVPEPPKGVAAYEPWAQYNDLVMTSFQLPWVNGELRYVGRLGEELSIAEGYECARVCALNGIAQLKDAMDDLDRVRLLRVEGHVGCVGSFEHIPQVLNGASDLLNEVFGLNGRHSRTALGHLVMPLRSPVMVGLWAQVVSVAD